jgi:hypothetical protein
MSFDYSQDSIMTAPQLHASMDSLPNLQDMQQQQQPPARAQHSRADSCHVLPNAPWNQNTRWINQVAPAMQGAFPSGESTPMTSNMQQQQQQPQQSFASDPFDELIAARRPVGALPNGGKQ